MKTFYSEKPGDILYMLLPNGEADVWLRRNIEEVEAEDGFSWTADEVYFKTELTIGAVETHFEKLFYEHSGGHTPTVEEQLAALNAAVAEMAQEVYGDD